MNEHHRMPQDGLTKLGHLADEMMDQSPVG